MPEQYERIARPNARIKRFPLSYFSCPIDVAPVAAALHCVQENATKTLQNATLNYIYYHFYIIDYQLINYSVE